MRRSIKTVRLFTTEAQRGSGNSDCRKTDVSDVRSQKGNKKARKSDDTKEFNG